MCSKYIPHQCLVVNHDEYYIHGLKFRSYIAICIENGSVQELCIVCTDTYLEEENLFKLALEITLAKLLKKKKGTYSKIRVFTSRVSTPWNVCLPKAMLQVLVRQWKLITLSTPHCIYETALTMPPFAFLYCVLHYFTIKEQKYR